MTRTISNRDDIIDSRDVIERIEELQDEKDSEISLLINRTDDAQKEIADLETEIEACEDQNEEDELREKLDALKEELDEAESKKESYEFDEEDELSALIALQEEAEGYASDWRHGETLIRETYWTEYVKYLLDDIGDLPRDLPDYIEIDWDATADNIKADYTEVDYGGVAYMIRYS